MVTLLRSSQRRHVQRGKHGVWHSPFPRHSPSPLADCFGLLVGFDETCLPPGESTEPCSDDEAETITYVFRGALSQEDTAGNSEVIHAGEFQRMSSGRGIRHKETSVSASVPLHMFRISLRPSEIGVDSTHEQKRFTAAQRRNLPCVVASHDGRGGSLHINQDAVVYSALLTPGHHLFHTLLPGRCAWLHVVCGEVTLNDVVLTQGDGLGVANEPSLSLTVQDQTEILLVDMGTMRRGRRTDEDRQDPTTPGQPHERTKPAPDRRMQGKGRRRTDAGSNK